jgi:signal transduction histidine kinase
MNHFSHTSQFIIISISTSLLSIFFIFSLIFAWRRRAQMREKEFLQTMSADRERIYKLLASELHDNISNLIATAIAYLHKLKRDDAAQKSTTETELLQLLERIHIETHNISQNMHANFVTEKGFLPLVEQELYRIDKLGNLTTQLKIKGYPQKIPHAKKTMIYRIFQEAVMNSLKHAGADFLMVRINYKANGDFVIVIADNGNGFIPENIEAETGKGLNNMHTRSRQLSGKLKIISRQKVGTYIHLYLPKLLPPKPRVKNS